MADKDESARKLIQWHFAADPDVRTVYRIVADNEAAPDEPIKLLEVHAATVASGSVDVFGFGPAGDIPYRVQIALVTPDEFERFKKDPNSLPKGWDLARAQVFERPQAAE